MGTTERGLCRNCLSNFPRNLKLFQNKSLFKKMPTRLHPFVAQQPSVDPQCPRHKPQLCFWALRALLDWASLSGFPEHGIQANSSLGLDSRGGAGGWFPRGRASGEGVNGNQTVQCDRALTGTVCQRPHKPGPDKRACGLLPAKPSQVSPPTPTSSEALTLKGKWSQGHPRAHGQVRI